MDLGIHDSETHQEGSLLLLMQTDTLETDMQTDKSG